MVSASYLYMNTVTVFRSYDNRKSIERHERTQKYVNSTIVESARLNFLFEISTGKKVSVSYALSRLHIEAHENVHNVTLLNFLKYLNTSHIYHNYEHMAYTIYKHKAKQQAQSRATSTNKHKT